MLDDKISQKPIKEVKEATKDSDYNESCLQDSDLDFLKNCAMATAVRHLNEHDYTPLEKSALLTFIPKDLDFGKTNLFSLTSGLESYFKKGGNLRKKMLHLNPEQAEIVSFLTDYAHPSQKYTLSGQEERYSTDNGVLRFFKALLWGEQNMFAFGKPIKRKSKLTPREYTVLEDPLITLHKGPLRGIRREDTVYVFDVFNKAMFERGLDVGKGLLALDVWYSVLEDLEREIKTLEKETGVSAATAKDDIDDVYLSETYDDELLRAPRRNKRVVRMVLRGNDVLDTLYRNAVVLKRIDKIKDQKLRALYRAVVFDSELKYVLLNDDKIIIRAPTIDSLLGDGFNSQKKKIEEVKYGFFSDDDEQLAETTKQLCTSSLAKAIQKI